MDATITATIITQVVTIGGFLVGFWKHNYETRLATQTERSMKHHERCLQAIGDITELMEQTRQELWLLGIRPFDRDIELDIETAKQLSKIGIFRTRIFSTHIFIPRELWKSIEDVYTAFNEFTRAIVRNSKDGKTALDAANDSADAAIKNWRRHAMNWVDEHQIAVEACAEAVRPAGAVSAAWRA